MFGHQDDKSSQPTANDTPDDLIKAAPDPDTIAADRPSGEPAEPPLAAAPAITSVDPAPAVTNPSPAADPAWQHPGTPIGASDQADAQPDQPPEQEQISDVISPAGGFPKHPTFSYQAGAPDPDYNSKPTAADDTLSGPTHELIDIRQKAVSELVPIIDKLDLPPLEKFRTIMMIIQVSDHEDLVKAAYEAAHSIPDEKDKAQALLDIVNEVNYFTHQPES